MVNIYISVVWHIKICIKIVGKQAAAASVSVFYQLLVLVMLTCICSSDTVQHLLGVLDASMVVWPQSSDLVITSSQKSHPHIRHVIVIFFCFAYLAAHFFC